jgi:ParB family chromosome partitioning protein
MASQKSKEIQSQASIIMKVPLDKIMPRPLNCNELDDETFNGLMEDIKLNGLRYPVLVRQIGQESYELVDGEHRWLAAKRLGWKEIEAQVVNMGEEDAEVANFKLNSGRGQLNPVKVAMLFDKERRRGLSQEKIGKKFNLSQQRVSQYLEILTFPEEIRNLLTNRLVGFTMEHARRITDIIKEPELQAQVAKKVIDEGLSVREAEAAAKVHLEQKKRREEWEKRKEELITVLDFFTRHGEWKSENCKHRGEDGYCRKWSWQDKPVDWMEKLPWLDTCKMEGKWYLKASPKFCSLCNSYTQKGDELDQLRESVNELYSEVYDQLSLLSSACIANGMWKKQHCHFFSGAYCLIWQWASRPIMLGKPAKDANGNWRIDPTPEYCAMCPFYHAREYQ